MVDYAWISPSRYWMGQNGPLYRPEHWDKIQEMDMWTNKFDPIMTCQPMGIPRQGEPRRIFHAANDITLFYTFSDYGGGNREYRMIPTDGRQHDANQARQATYLGYSVGKWEGDTLVVDSISFVDSTWLGRGGLFHSGDMRIVEKFTRKGNEILHEMTIHDPESFIEPWVMPARTLTLGNGDTLIAERAHCEVYEDERHHQSDATLEEPNRSLRALASGRQAEVPQVHPAFVPTPRASSQPFFVHPSAPTFIPAPLATCRDITGVPGSARQSRSARKPRYTPAAEITYFGFVQYFRRLTMNKRTFVAVVLLGLIAASPVLAHHSLAGVYDLNKTERATGVVAEVCVYEPARRAAYRNQERGGRGQGVAADDRFCQRPDQRRGHRHRPESGQGGRHHHRHLQSGAQRRHHRVSPIDRFGGQERSRVCTQLTAR